MVAVDRALDPSASADEVWAVSSGERISLRQLVTLWERVAGVQVDIVWGGRQYRDREVMVPWEGPALPGWKPQHTVTQGLTCMESRDQEISNNE